jgi:hypothetical protein
MSASLLARAINMIGIRSITRDTRDAMLVLAGQEIAATAAIAVAAASTVPPHTSARCPTFQPNVPAPTASTIPAT